MIFPSLCAIVSGVDMIPIRAVFSVGVIGARTGVLPAGLRSFHNRVRSLARGLYEFHQVVVGVEQLLRKVPVRHEYQDRPPV